MANTRLSVFKGIVDTFVKSFGYGLDDLGAKISSNNVSA